LGIRVIAASLDDELLQFLQSLLDLSQIHQEKVHLQPIHLRQGNLSESGNGLHGGPGLVEKFSLRVVPPQDVPDLVGQLRLPHWKISLPMAIAISSIQRGESTFINRNAYSGQSTCSKAVLSSCWNFKSV